MTNENAIEISKPKGYAWVILVIVWLAGFTAPCNNCKVITLAPVLMQEFGIGTDAIGWVIAMFYVIGVILAFPAATVVKKLGIKRGIIIALVCGAVGTLISGVAANLGMFMVGRVIEGAGFGLMGVLGVPAISEWFPPNKRGLVLGIWAIWIAVAMFACPYVYAAITDSVGWKTVWWVNLVLDIVILVLFVILHRSPDFEFDERGCMVPLGTVEKTDDSENLIKISEVLKNKTVIMLAICFFFDQAAFVAIQSFTTTYLTGVVGTSLKLASVIVSVFALVGLIAAPLLGAVSDRINSRRKILIFALACGVVYSAMVFMMKSVPIYWVIALFAGLTGGGVPAIMWAAVPEAVGDDRGTVAATAVLSFSMNLGMFFGATVVGTTIASIGWTASALGVLTPGYLIALVIAIFGLKKVK